MKDTINTIKLLEILEKAQGRLENELKQKELGADNRDVIDYWRGYIDGVRACLKVSGWTDNRW